MTGKQHTNQLINETSPYLLQHAHNPVDWYPWGPEALERSRKEDKPILLSIGYSACHWCHVMEHESFENEDIAKMMNDNFVCIKVDREERPDLDSIYMNAVQMMTGHGGWPMTMFLTPDLKPFYGGTYYPPEDRRGMAGFPKVLTAITDSYKNRRPEILASADAITAELKKGDRFVASNELLTTEVLNSAFSALTGSFDQRHGGFGGAPKFPPSMTLMFLLRHHKRTNSAQALEMVETTLRKMAGGGMYDHLGGGFARYSVDARWLVPHFEKMLYDNALLTRIYLQAYQQTKNPLYRRIAEETLEYIIRDMTDRSGGFYSSEDADSEGEEGKFYVWTRSEVLDLLGADDGEVFCEFFDVTDEGNFEHGKSILNTPQTLEEFVADKEMSADALTRIINAGKRRLFNVREQRVRPGRDDKTLAAWNGLMLTAFAEAANILGRDDYREIAVRNAEFLTTELMRDGRLLRTYKAGQAKLNGYLEDYAYVIEGLLAVYEATFELRFFTRARELADTMIDQFWDEQDGGFYFTSSDHEELITRTKDYFDNATPSGNSVAAAALLKLAVLTQQHDYSNNAVTILRALRPAMSRYPSAFGYMLSALDFYLSEPKEIAIVGKLDSHEVRSFAEEVYSRYLPNKVVAASEPGDEAAAAAIRLLIDRSSVGSTATAYVCRNYTCLAPATTAEELAARLDE
ncbi:MAG TPA: thioredoxin domain-containing protein [Blastocatellia bacterium]|nr:thioredoxin domain-containing protein [Blastocatellia bacterium]